MPVSILYSILTGATAVAVIAIVVVLKKSAQVKNLKVEINRLKEDYETRLQEFADLQQNFDVKVDEVVQSSIMKISHAEEAKDEAIKAAQDNYEAAADAHAQLREKEALIEKLQSQLQ